MAVIEMPTKTKQTVPTMHSKIQTVPLGKMRVSIEAQRRLRPERVDYLLSKLDIEKLGYIVVNSRGGFFYVIDGQHRVEMLKRWLGDGWENQQIECRCYFNMSEKQEADMFLALNDGLSVRAFDKFKVGVTAGQSNEIAIKKAVEGEGLTISDEKIAGAISCVGTLRRVFRRSDAPTLARALRLAHESFGDPGLGSAVIDGFGYLVQRYDSLIGDKDVVERLSSMRGGVGALITRAEVLRKQTGTQLSQCIAAAIVDKLNEKRTKKLVSWWKA